MSINQIRHRFSTKCNLILRLYYLFLSLIKVIENITTLKKFKEILRNDTV